MRKIITVPIDKQALDRLNYNENMECDVIDVFLNERDLMNLWSEPLFGEINEQLNIIIDDFEEERIIGKDNLIKLHSIVLKYVDKIDNPIIPTLKSLTEAAIRFDTGVYFFF